MATKVINKNSKHGLNAINSNNNIDLKSISTTLIDHLSENLPAYLSNGNERVDLCKEIRVRRIEDFIAFIEENKINILLPNDNFFTAFHTLLQASHYSDFK